jgi:hypothetical protein
MKHKSFEEMEFSQKIDLSTFFKGLKEKGVFRVCGSDSKIKAYRRAVDQGQDFLL